MPSSAAEFNTARPPINKPANIKQCHCQARSTWQSALSLTRLGFNVTAKYILPLRSSQAGMPVVRSPSPVTTGVDGSMPMSQHTHGSSESSLSISNPTKSSIALSNKRFLVRLCERYMFCVWKECRSKLRNSHSHKETCNLPA